ncbi:hypothetical protein BDV12DRAFT_196846 [Aspergillus spectabilis]
MLLHVGPILFSIILSALPSLSLPNPNEVALEKITQHAQHLRIPALKTHLPDPVFNYNHSPLAKRQTEPFNCTATCTFTDAILQAGNDVCITIQADATSNDPTARGASLTMVRTTVEAGNNININVVDRSRNGLVVLWLEDVTLSAGGTINLNFGEEEGCLDDACEVIIYMRNVTWVSQGTGQVNRDSSATTTATTATSTTSTTNVGIPSTTQSSTDPSATASTTTSSTTTTLPPTPTTVPQIDRFSFIGCYVDTADARILVADSSEGENPDGMTVEKCIALAKNGVWRYAGVEFGSQCFVGNTLHGSDQFPDSDCNMICAGNPSELCGDSGRIQVYEDSTWSDPTVEELAEAVRQYSATVEEVRSALADYRRIMADLEEYLSSTSASKVKRDAQLQEFEMEIFQKGNTLKRLQAEEQTKRQITEVRLKRGQALDTTIISKVPGLIIEKWATTGSLAQQLNSVIKILQSNVEVLKEANNQGITPVIDAGAAVAEVDAVLKLIGLNLALGVVGSFFYILGGIIKFFEGGSGDTGPEPTDTTTTKTTTTALSTTTTSTTTSTTTTTCSPTATPTSIGIITKQGTSLSQFNELIASLPQDPDSIQLTNSWQPNFLYVGNMDDCTTDTLSGNPLVEFWTAASDSQPIFYINENGIPECKV